MVQDEQQTMPVSESAQVALQAFQRFLNEVLSESVRTVQEQGLEAPPSQAKYFQNRLDRALSFYRPALLESFKWLFSSRENTNHTYDITDHNKLYIATMCSVVTGISTSTLHGYIDELSQDQQLRDHIRHATENATFATHADPIAKFGRRICWYVLTRALKPKLVVETGVDKGLGSCVLAAALLRNRADGYPGQYLGTDISPSAGFLFSGQYAEAGEILYADSIKSLKTISTPIDLFINDSDHSAEYEAREYECIAHLLNDRSVIIGDNAHATDKLCQFANKSQRKFIFIPEWPREHWYPGAGVGIAFR